MAGSSNSDAGCELQGFLYSRTMTRISADNRHVIHLMTSESECSTHYLLVPNLKIIQFLGVCGEVASFNFMERFLGRSSERSQNLRDYRSDDL